MVGRRGIEGPSDSQGVTKNCGARVSPWHSGWEQRETIPRCGVPQAFKDVTSDVTQAAVRGEGHLGGDTEAKRAQPTLSLEGMRLGEGDCGRPAPHGRLGVDRKRRWLKARLAVVGDAQAFQGSCPAGPRSPALGYGNPGSGHRDGWKTPDLCPRWQFFISCFLFPQVLPCSAAPPS